jgi:hypothetical protein
MQRKQRVTAASGSLVFAWAALAACSSYGGPPPGGDVAPSYSTASASITVGPPDLPVYEQPVCPGDGYVWTPGYWAWSSGDYYWVPGTWVEAPQVGYLWTPGYWGWGGNAFIFHEGYWGEQVGFYGGIDYGHGYSGQGYDGGRWDNGHFAYNRSVSNVDETVVHNVYNTTVVNNTTIVNNTTTHVSYNGGKGGITARATAQEQAAAQARHIPPVAAQTEHVQAARSNPQLQASANHGNPPIAATSKPGALSEPGVVAATEGGATHSAALPVNNGPRPNTAVHPNELPSVEHAPAPNTGNPKLDQQYQQQQAKLLAQQIQDRAKLQQKQDQDHQRLAQQKADPATTQKVEQQHAQQTQQLAQKHAQQLQTLKAHQQPPHQGQAVATKDKP